MRYSITTYAITLSMLLVAGCKKTKLDGELSVLVGSWEWKYTILRNNLCEYLPAPIITHTPDQDGFICRLELKRKGKLEIWINGKKDKTYRLVRRDFADTSPDTSFSFALNNKKHDAVLFTYAIISGKEYLKSAYFPQSILNGFDGCRSEYSVFEKVE